MKKVVTSKFSLVALVICLFVLNCFPNLIGAENAPYSPPTFELKRSGNDFAAFHYNQKGKVYEYYLIQVSDFFPFETDIQQAVYTEGSDITLVGKNGHTYVFSIKDRASNSSTVHKFSVAGIAHYIINDQDGLALKDIQPIALNTGGGGSTPFECDGACLSGGCGSTECSRTVGPVGCSVSCNTGYFACCGDLVSYGCKCVRDCCKK